jgi:predicted nucleic acid-binding protein
LSVVVDANLLVVLALDRTRAPAVEAQLRQWRTIGEQLHAPSLLRYEVTSALARAVAAGQLAGEQVAGAWQQITSVPVMLHPLDPDFRSMWA